MGRKKKKNSTKQKDYTVATMPKLEADSICTRFLEYETMCDVNNPRLETVGL